MSNNAETNEKKKDNVKSIKRMAWANFVFVLFVHFTHPIFLNISTHLHPAREAKSLSYISSSTVPDADECRFLSMPGAFQTNGIIKPFRRLPLSDLHFS